MESFNNTRNLYVSDLDGTLLDKGGELSAYSKKIITRFIEAGGAFTVCTGRSLARTQRFVEELGIRLPYLCFNGSMVYCPEENRFLRKQCIQRDLALELLHAFNAHQIGCMFNGIRHDRISTLLHNSPRNAALQAFIQPRTEGSEVIELTSSAFTVVDDMDVTQIVSIHENYEGLQAIAGECAKQSDIDALLVERFDENTQWFLEITAKDSNKGSGVTWLKNHVGARQIVCFGDYLNDLSMFENSDMAVAVENAVDEIKALADRMTDSNCKAGVASFINKHYSLFPDLVTGE